MSHAAESDWQKAFIRYHADNEVSPTNNPGDEPEFQAYSGYSVTSNRPLDLLGGFTQGLNRFPHRRESGFKTREKAEDRLIELQMIMGGHEGVKEAQAARSAIMASVHKYYRRISELSLCSSSATERDGEINHYWPESHIRNPQFSAAASPSTSNIQGPDHGREQQSGSSQDLSNHLPCHYQTVQHNPFPSSAPADCPTHQSTGTLRRKRRGSDDSDGTLTKRQNRGGGDGGTDSQIHGQGTYDQDTEMGDTEMGE